MSSPSLYARLLAAGVPMEHHPYGSDLYVPVTETTRAILGGDPALRGVTLFRSAIDGTWWYDVPFAYEPFWETVRARSLRETAR